MKNGYIYEVGHRNHEKTTPLREQGLGNPKGRSGLPAEMHRMRAPDYDRAQTGGKKY